MSIATVRAVAAPVQSREDALFGFLAPTRHVRDLIAECRADYPADSDAHRSFRSHLPREALSALLCCPTDPVTEHAMRALARLANWDRLAADLFDHLTPDRLAEMDTLDREAADAERYARADDYADANPDEPLPHIGWDERTHEPVVIWDEPTLAADPALAFA